MEMTKTETRSIKEFVRENPARTKFFNEKKIDYCCGGDQLLDEALAEKGFDPIAFYEEMKAFEADNQAMTNRALTTDIINLSVPELLNHLQETHHVTERKLLFEIDQSLNKILRVHFEAHGEELIELHNLFADLKKDLEVHFVREDEIHFPAIRKAWRKNAITPELIAELKELEEDHDAAGELIHKIQSLTNDFTAPQGTCMTYERTYALLKELIESVFIHIYKENSVLFDTLERSI